MLGTSGAPGRGPAVVQVITHDRGKEALSFSHEGFESLTLASLAPVVAKCANWSHMGKWRRGKTLANRKDPWLSRACSDPRAKL